MIKLKSGKLYRVTSPGVLGWYDGYEGEARFLALDKDTVLLYLGSLNPDDHDTTKFLYEDRIIFISGGGRLFPDADAWDEPYELEFLELVDLTKSKKV